MKKLLVKMLAGLILVALPTTLWAKEQLRSAEMGAIKVDAQNIVKDRSGAEEVVLTFINSSEDAVLVVGVVNLFDQDDNIQACPFSQRVPPVSAIEEFVGMVPFNCYGTFVDFEVLIELAEPVQAEN